MGQKALGILSGKILRQSVFDPDIVRDQLGTLVTNRSLEATREKLKLFPVIDINAGVRQRRGCAAGSPGPACA